MSGPGLYKNVREDVCLVVVHTLYSYINIYIFRAQLTLMYICSDDCPSVCIDRDVDKKIYSYMLI